MNDDYLWDRTGEPDLEIQQLEQVLGTLRYQPRPLELPAHVRIGRPRTFFPRIAIAAAVATMLVGGVAWILLLRQDASVAPRSASHPPAVENLKNAPVTPLAPTKDGLVESRIVTGTLDKKRKRSGISKSQMARTNQFLPIKPTSTELTARDRAEAQVAKEQLLLALRVASAKLSLAQKKAQGAYPGNPIRNQHKVG